MRFEITIDLMDPGSNLLEKLAIEARRQGYSFMDRLLDEARSGKNVFQNHGECFCGVFIDESLVGCGGINQDPYIDQNVGRLRHVYVLDAYRRNGIAAELVRSLLRRCKPAFNAVRLRTPDESAGKFYDALGFKRANRDTATHLIEV